ncbi:hypothetical protein DFH09DRAFT_1166362 [Mycena vulgaris]|nr:hypothetical protein DFH09DRAFT_1166362 [Mycena vulgaris]
MIDGGWLITFLYLTSLYLSLFTPSQPLTFLHAVCSYCHFVSLSVLHPTTRMYQLLVPVPLPYSIHPLTHHLIIVRPFAIED